MQRKVDRRISMAPQILARIAHRYVAILRYMLLSIPKYTPLFILLAFALGVLLIYQIMPENRHILMRIPTWLTGKSTPVSVPTPAATMAPTSTSLGVGWQALILDGGISLIIGAMIGAIGSSIANIINARNSRERSKEELAASQNQASIDRNLKYAEETRIAEERQKLLEDELTKEITECLKAVQMYLARYTADLTDSDELPNERLLLDIEITTSVNKVNVAKKRVFPADVVYRTFKYDGRKRLTPRDSMLEIRNYLYLIQQKVLSIDGEIK